MARLAEYFETNKPDFEKEGLDFFNKFGLTYKANLDQSYGEAQIKEEELVTPAFTNYKMTSLDWKEAA